MPPDPPVALPVEDMPETPDDPILTLLERFGTAADFAQGAFDRGGFEGFIEAVKALPPEQIAFYREQEAERRKAEEARRKVETDRQRTLDAINNPSWASRARRHQDRTDNTPRCKRTSHTLHLYGRRRTTRERHRARYRVPGGHGAA